MFRDDQDQFVRWVCLLVVLIVVALWMRWAFSLAVTHVYIPDPFGMTNPDSPISEFLLNF